MENSKTTDTAFFGHPRGLSTLFFTEMWERFSYYGMRAILILFMTAPAAMGGLGWTVDRAGAIYGTYAASVYLMCLPGGWVADKVMGLRRSVFWGGVMIMLGQASLAMPNSGVFFYPGLVLIALGTGLLKPNISALVGQLYTAGDVRRDSGFSIYYMGINLGAFLSPLVCGWFAQSDKWRAMLAGWGIAPETSWHFGFACGAIGMALGLLQYVFTGRYLGDAGLEVLGAQTPEQKHDARRKFSIAAACVAGVIAAVVLLSVLGAVAVEATGVARAMDILLVIGTIAFWVWIFAAGTWTPEERKRLVVILVLFLGASVFWAAFEQAASTLNLFAERQTRNSILGLSYPASWLQSVNALMIILFAPIVGAIWFKMGKRDPSSPAKFTMGLFFLGLGFVVMVLAAQAAASGEKVSPMWLVLTYFLHTIGELCLSPVGLSAMTRLAPARVVGLMMGVWFLATSIGNKIAGSVARVYESFSLPSLFGAVAAFALFFALVMGLLVGPIRRMMEKRA